LANIQLGLDCVKGLVAETLKLQACGWRQAAMIYGGA
jgi:hypothetical protein